MNRFVIIKSENNYEKILNDRIKLYESKRSTNE